jgi:hypothetical protein
VIVDDYIIYIDRYYIYIYIISCVRGVELGPGGDFAAVEGWPVLFVGRDRLVASQQLWKIPSAAWLSTAFLHS